jgi:hypothetical protein
VYIYTYILVFTFPENGRIDNKDTELQCAHFTNKHDERA